MASIFSRTPCRAAVPRLFKRSCGLQRCFSQSQNENKDRTSTIDEKEVELHTKMSSTWWDAEKGPMKALHAMNSVRIPFIRTGLINNSQLKEHTSQTDPEYLKGVSILDIGCGGGILSIPLSRLGANVTGVEPSSELVNLSQSIAEKEKLTDRTKFLATSIEEYVSSSENREIHDVVICSEVIEHVTKKELFIEACLTALKPGGSIFFTTINRTSVAWALAIVMAEQMLGIVPAGTHQYDKLITPEELTEILKNKNCTTRMVHGYMYDPITNKFFWMPCTTVLYSLHAVKCK